MRKQFARSVALVLFSASVAQAQNRSSEFAHRLQEADRLSWLTNWYEALPIYDDVERAATKAGDRRDAIYAKFGRLRGQMQTLPLPDISEQIANDLTTSLAKNNPRLRLRALTVKGDIDLEWDVHAAQRDWQEARELARTTGESPPKAWLNQSG